MTNVSKSVVTTAVSQPVVIRFPQADVAAATAIKQSPLYQKAAGVRSEQEVRNTLALVEPVTTNQWDTVSICRVSALNKAIESKKTYPKSIEHSLKGYFLSATFQPWRITRGGDGKNLHMLLPLASGTYINNYQKRFELKGAKVLVEIKLNYFPLPDTRHAQNGSYDLKVKTEQTSEYEPIASAIKLLDTELSFPDYSLCLGLFSSWLNIPENLKKLETVFTTVLINNVATENEDFKWLRATSMSYAYTDTNRDTGTDDDGIFGVLCMTNDRPIDHNPNQLPAIQLTSDQEGMLLISRAAFLRYQLLPALPYIFNDSTPKFEVDSAGTTITASDLKLDSVEVKGTKYYPVAKDFVINFDETYIRTSATIETIIEPGVTVISQVSATQTLKLVENDRGEKVMTYEMVGEPKVSSQTKIESWVIVTEIIMGIVALVITLVAGALGGVAAALMVGLVLALAIAIVSVNIHVLISQCLAGKVEDCLPTILPMVKMATAHVQWPFTARDAFTLSNITYNGAIILDGTLKLANGYSMENNRLVYQEIPA